jgi:LEA14-like dessication related protein
MKITSKIFIAFSVLSLLAFSAPKAAIEWEFTEYDFGKIDKNKPVTIDFKFNNPGMVPLIIQDVKTSCGCTVPEFPKQPIPPKGSGKITVTYDAKDSGYFSKTVTVLTNTEQTTNLLYIKGEVK